MAGPSDETPACTRRQLLRASAGVAGAGAALYGGNRANLVGTAQADSWQIVKDALTATSGYAYAYDYLMGTDYTGEATTRLANYAHRRFGDMRNYDGYTGADALITEVETGLKEMQLASEQIMTGIDNQIEMSDNVGYSKGKVALIESLNGGNDVTTAKSDMNTVLNAYYTSIQKNIIEHWNTQFNQLMHMGGRVTAHSNLNLEEHFYAAIDTDSDAATPAENQYFRDWAAYDYINGEGSSSTQYTVLAEQQTLEYLNGDTEQVWVGYPTDWNPSGSTTMLTPVSPSNQSAMSGAGIVSQGFAFTGNATTSGNVMIDSPDVSAVVLNGRRYWSAYSKLKDARDRVNADLQGFADDLYSQYQSGDISLAEVVDPITYATEMSTDHNNEPFREASAAQMGIPSAAAFNTKIEVYTDDGSGNEVSSQFETALYTAHQPTDADGNAIDWQVGTRYSPSTWADPLFVTYPSNDGTRDMTQLEKDFKIVSATDQSGSSLDSFGNRQTNVQTADVATIKEELQRLREAQDQLLAEQTDSGSTGGGGSSGDSGFLSGEWMGVPKAGWLLGGTGVSLLGYEFMSDDDDEYSRRGGGRY